MGRPYPAPAQRSSIDHVQVPAMPTSTVNEQIGNNLVKDNGSRGPLAGSAVAQEQFAIGSGSMLSFGFREPTAMPTPATLFAQ